jgi:FtsP/CotA-like multicopper oxidase with cupredoxin domain
VAKQYTGWQDGVTVPYPISFDAPPGEVVVRISFTDFPGRWLFHCHIASHEDNGMMSFIDVVRTPILPFTL